MRLLYSQHQRYACQGCGLCCRRFRVQLTRDEERRIQEHDWHGILELPFAETIDGGRFFKRNDRHQCVFLDEQNRCRIHNQMGGSAKALSCKGYPFSVVPTFSGEISVSVRMDCPAALQNTGVPLNAHSREVEQLIHELGLTGGGFSNRHLADLTESAAKELCSRISQLLPPTTRSLHDTLRMLMLFARHAEQLGATFLNDHDVMAQVYPTYEKQLQDELPEQPKYDLSLLDRCLFRRLLITYCRRDEELLRTDIGARLRHAWHIALLTLGRGSLRSIGNEHPDLPLSAVNLQDKCSDLPRACWEPYIRFLQVKLETYQFFGPAFYGADIFTGLKALFLTYPLVLTLAKLHAAARQTAIDLLDIHYAVSAVDHSFGRNPALAPTLKHQAALSEHFNSLLVAIQ